MPPELANGLAWGFVVFMTIGILFFTGVGLKTIFDRFRFHPDSEPKAFLSEVEVKALARKEAQDVWKIQLAQLQSQEIAPAV